MASDPYCAEAPSRSTSTRSIAAVGIAFLGSLLSAGYRNSLGDSFASMPADVNEIAKNSVGAALQVAEQFSVESGQVQISSGDHFFNQDPGDGDNPVYYSFRFFMVDDQGNEVASIPELETEYFINYQYQAQSFSISENIFEQIKIFKIDNNLIEKIVQKKQVPIISPLGLGNDNHPYNINGDTAAGAIAKSLRSRRLLLMTNVEGVLDKNKKLIDEISSSEILKMIENNTITEGMIPKINTCLDAVNNGVTAVGIIDGRKQHSILFEIFSDKGSGTLIRK